MSSDYVRVTFIGLRAPGDIKALPPTNDDIRDVLFVGDCGELDIILDDIRSITVEDISREEAWPADWGPYEPDSPDEDETPSWAIDAQQDEREVRESLSETLNAALLEIADGFDAAGRDE